MQQDRVSSIDDLESISCQVVSKEQLNKNAEVSTLDDIMSDSDCANLFVNTGNETLDKAIKELQENYQIQVLDKEKRIEIEVHLPVYFENLETNKTESEHISVNIFTDKSFPLAPAELEIKDSDRISVLKDEATKQYPKLKSNNPSLIKLIEQFYILLENKSFPSKTIQIRDFCFHVHDPRHWGRPFNTETVLEVYPGMRVRALFDFDADNDKELTFKENDILVIHERENSGWLYASLEIMMEKKGLIPENFISFISSD